MCTWVTINSLSNLWSKSHLKLYKMDKYGLKKRYDFVPQFSPLRPGTVCSSGRYLQSWYRKMDRTGHVTSMIEYLSVTDDVVVDFCGNSLNFIHVLTYISSSFDINENLWTSDHLVKIKDWASTVCGPQIHSVEAYRWIPIPRRKVRNWKHRSRR